MKIEKIKEKIEIKDMQVNGDPCKYYFDEYGWTGQYDCMNDCIAPNESPAYGSVVY